MKKTSTKPKARTKVPTKAKSPAKRAPAQAKAKAAKAPAKRAPAQAKAKAPAKGKAPAKRSPLRRVKLDVVRDALAAVAFELPHADFAQLPAPYALALGSVTLDELRDVSGTVVVLGHLHVKGDVALRRISGLPNLVVTGDMTARHVYADAFLVVGGTLAALTVIGDAAWDGALFVGSLEADTVVLKDTGLELLGKGAKKDKIRVRRLADLESPAKAKKAVPELFDLDPEADDVPAYAYFLTLAR